MEPESLVPGEPRRLQTYQEVRQGLTDLQWAFAEAYVENGGEAKAAAKAAGYSTGDLAKRGYENLERPKVRAAIRYLLHLAGISTEHVIAQLLDVAQNSRLDNVMRVQDGRLVPDFERAEELGALKHIKKIKRGQFGVEIEMYDRARALVKLAAMIERTQEREKDELGTAAEQLEGVGLSIGTLQILNLYESP